MEKIVLKNMYLNIVIGVLLIISSLLGYFLGWFETYLPIVTAVILILLSGKRFIYSIRNTKSKNASLILVGEFLLDLVFAGLLIYLGDHVSIFIGLIIYLRGFTYLLINYVSSRSLKLLQYLLNIGYITFASYLLFTSTDNDTVLIVGISVLMLLVGAIFLQVGLTDLTKKEKKEKEVLKVVESKKIEKQKEKIEDLKTEVKEIKETQKKQEQENKQLHKEVEKTKPKLVNLEAMTLPELKVLAKSNNITGYSQLKKVDLIALIKQAEKFKK